MPAMSFTTPATKEMQIVVANEKFEGGSIMSELPLVLTAADVAAIVWSVVGHVDPPDFTKIFPVAPYTGSLYSICTFCVTEILVASLVGVMLCRVGAALSTPTDNEPDDEERLPLTSS